MNLFPNTQNMAKADGLLQLIAHDPDKLNTEGKRFEAMFKFARERHLVYLRKASGLPRPWTEDWTLQSYRYCNIYREIDSVSLWVRNNIIRPYEGCDDLPFLLVAARIFNKPKTLQALLDAGVIGGTRFNPDRAVAVLHKVKSVEGAVFNSAYIINGIPKKGAPEREGKAGTVCHDVLAPMWKDRCRNAEPLRASMQSALDTLKQYHGMGRFMSYQVAVDLSYSKYWLANAHDLNEVTSPGPGTTLGAKFLAGCFKDKSVRLSQEVINDYLKETRRLSHLEKYWPVDSMRGSSCEKGFVPLTIPNCSNTFCETSKAMDLYLGHRKRLKNSYQGGLSQDHRQVDLF
jgi:hypothetical protein